MRDSRKLMTVALVAFAAAVSMVLGLDHVCVATDSKPDNLQPQTLASENKKALVKAAAFYELFDKTGEYFPLKFREMKYYHHVDPILSSISLRDSKCGAELVIHFQENVAEGTYRIELVQLFLKEAFSIRHVCNNNNTGIEFKSDERLAIDGPLVLKCLKETEGPAHAEIVFPHLEIELDGDEEFISELRFSKPTQKDAKQPSTTPPAVEGLSRVLSLTPTS